MVLVGVRCVGCVFAVAGCRLGIKQLVFCPWSPKLSLCEVSASLNRQAVFSSILTLQSLLQGFAEHSVRLKRRPSLLLWKCNDFQSCPGGAAPALGAVVNL